MAISVFQLFSIGIGPSSSHTVGPMRAALKFIELLKEHKILTSINRIIVDLYGSLALTGKGHATDIAVLLGLEGETPERVDPHTIAQRVAAIKSEKKLTLKGSHPICFVYDSHLLFHKDKLLPKHPNGMRFTAFGTDGQELFSKVYYSVGGGFIVEHGETTADKNNDEGKELIPYPFRTADELLQICRRMNMRIADVVMENEKTWRSPEEIRNGLLAIWEVMQGCVERGCSHEGILPGGLNVKRRAAPLFKSLVAEKEHRRHDPVAAMKWASLWALAVNEENAAGGRVVTAPTNGAAGVIPAVLHYYTQFTDYPTKEGVIEFFLTAGAIGKLYKIGASISAAEMGCMGEVGVACSMAAAGLTAALGGTNEQVENAAEIGMEHNLGLTCDPIMGLVQIPCIERNTMGAVKAINASLLALAGDGTHRVSLDQVIATMRETGRDMQTIYKETSLGGLAVNVPEC